MQFFNKAYSLHGNPIKLLEEIHYFGVIMKSKLIFDSHLEYVINQANRQLGFIMRNYDSFEGPESVLALYYSSICCRSNCVSVVWFPQYTTNNQRLENIQNIFFLISIA